MEFYCPNCERVEEIIGDRKPRCRFCRVEMVAESRYDEVFMAPLSAMNQMGLISTTYGAERARTDGKFKREREAWTTAMVGLALSKLDGREYWVQIETVNSTPDTRLMRIDATSGGNIFEIFPVEVVDWEKHVNNIMTVIRKKCARRYPKDYLLVVNARHTGKPLDFDRVINDMKTLRSPFAEVWIVMYVATGNIKVVRVAPTALSVDLTQADFVNARKQKAYLKRGTRGTSTELEDVGLVYVPIPRGKK